MGLRKNKNKEKDSGPPKPTYISFDDDFYHLTTPIDAADFDLFGADCVADVTDLGLTFHEMLAYAELVATFVVEQGVRFCVPLGPTAFGRKRVELAKGTKMGLLTVGGALWRRIECSDLDPRMILLSSEEKFNTASLFSAHFLAGLFLWWKIWRKEQYAARDENRPVQMSVVSDGKASRRFVSLPLQHMSSCISGWAGALSQHPFQSRTYSSELPRVYASTRLPIRVGSISGVLLPVEQLSSPQRTLIERAVLKYYAGSQLGAILKLSSLNDPRLEAAGYHASEFCWNGIGQRKYAMHPSVKGVVDDYWQKKYCQNILHPGKTISVEEFSVDEKGDKKSGQGLQSGHKRSVEKFVVDSIPAPQVQVRSPPPMVQPSPVSPPVSAVQPSPVGQPSPVSPAVQPVPVVQPQPRRIPDPARDRRPPDPPASRPAPVQMQPPQQPRSEPRSSLDIAAEEIIRAEVQALERKEALKCRVAPAPARYNNAPNPAELDEQLRTELRRLEEEAWQRRLDEMRWRDGRAGGSSPSQDFGRTSYESSSRQVAWADSPISQYSGLPYDQPSPSSAHDARFGSVASRQSSATSQSVHRGSFGSSAYGHGAPLSHMNSAQAYTSRPSQRALAPVYDSMTDKAMNETPRGSLGNAQQSPTSPANKDTSQATLACLLLAHILHNTGMSPGPSQDGGSHAYGDQRAMNGGPPPNARGPPIDTYRSYSWDDPEEAIDLDSHTPPSMHNPHGSMRMRPSGPRYPRANELHHPAFGGPMGSGEQYDAPSIRAETPPSPVLVMPSSERQQYGSSQQPRSADSFGHRQQQADPFGPRHQQAAQRRQVSPPGYSIGIAGLDNDPDEPQIHVVPPTIPASPPPNYTDANVLCPPTPDPWKQNGTQTTVVPVLYRNDSDEMRNRHEGDCVSQ